CLLPDGSLARLAQLGDLPVAQSLQLKKRHVAFGGCQPPAIELLVDGSAESGEEVLRLPIPSSCVGRPSAHFLLSQSQLDVELVGAPLRGRHLPPVKRHAAERRDENYKLERFQGECDAITQLDSDVDRHQERNQPKK